MINEKKVKLILFGSLVVAIICYHLLFLIQQRWLGDTDAHISSLTAIARILTTIIITILALNWRPLVKLVLGRAYVAGDYIGISNQQSHSTPITYTEEYTITQSILVTKISGRSNVNGANRSNWHGTLIDYDDLRFRFFIELDGSGGVRTGILTLRIYNQEASGTYAPTATRQQEFVSTFQTYTVSLHEEMLKNRPV